MPGLNAVIKSVVYRATEAGYEVHRDPPRLGGADPPPAGPDAGPELPAPLDRINTRTIERTGGTVLHTSRTNPRKMRAGGLPSWMDAATPAATLDRRRRVRPDARRPRQPRRRSASTSWSPSAATTRCRTRRCWSNAGVPLVAIPKTMDNDVQGTEYCIGFSTAITRAKEAINRQRTTLGIARADRRLPDLRARCRVLGAVHRVRDVRPVRHPRDRPTTSMRWPTCSPPTIATTRATTRSSSRPRARSGPAHR